MAGEKFTTRLAAYRRRLALAAVASVALHLLLAKGLAVTHLGIDVSPDAAPAQPLKPKRRADFPLAVPRSPATERPAHERPLDVRMRPPEQRRRQPPPKRPDRNVAERRAAEQAEWMPAASGPQAARTAASRDTALTAAAAAGRQTAVSASQAASAAADLAAIGAAAATPAAKSPTPAAAPAVPRAEPAPLASRWRPREVALLERLTASQAAPATRTASPRDAEPVARSSAAATRAATVGEIGAETAATADAIQVPAAAVGAVAAAAPAARQRPQAATQGGAIASRTTAAADDAPAAAAPSARTAVAVAGVRAARPATGDVASAPTNGAAPDRRQARPGATGDATAPIELPAAAAAATAAPQIGGGAKPAAAGRPASSEATASALTRTGPPGGAAGDAGGDAGPTAGASGCAAVGIAAPRSAGGGPVAGDATAPAAAAAPARAVGLAAAGAAAGTDLVAVVSPAAVSGGAGAVAAPPTPGPAPAAVGRFAAGAGQPDRAAVARPRPGADEGDDGEGLSVSLADAAAPLGGGISRRAGEDGLAAAAPVSPARIAAAALPAEGRVRDVSEAFAKRAPGKRDPDRERPPEEARAAALIDRGLDFLVRSQQADGRWALGRFAGSTAADVPKLESDTAATGLALLCFLGAGHDHFDGPHRDTVRRGLEFLLAVQKPDGDLYLPADDLSNSCAWLYSHGIASIALCEAVGMTGDPRIKPAAEKACGFIAASQHPTRGGWRYTPRSDADLSVSGWMLVAVRSGDLAGLKTDPRTLAGVRTLLEAAASRGDPARYAYNPLKPEQRTSPLSAGCMTAVGALMRLHTGATADDPRVVQAARALAALPPDYGTAARKTRDSYLWYYASQVLVHTGGPEWRAWYGRLVGALSATQETAGPRAGSWDPLGEAPDRWGIYGGRLYVTALHLLALEVPDRHLPTYSAAKR
ncbi:MAG: prenyltransferase/squalene oxidase repeat-containing protein [Planctomycetia bacterium]